MTRPACQSAEYDLRSDPEALDRPAGKMGQSDVASGRGRGDKQHLRNTSRLPRKVSRACRQPRVKNTNGVIARRSSSRSSEEKEGPVREECLASLEDSLQPDD